MSLAHAQQATRRLTVLQTREAIHEQLVTAKEARAKKIDLPIELTVRSQQFDTDPFDLTFFYQDEKKNSRWLILIGKSSNRQRARIYIPIDPTKEVEATLPNY